MPLEFKRLSHPRIVSCPERTRRVCAQNCTPALQWLAFAPALLLLIGTSVSAATLEVRTGTSSDDAEEFANGTMYLSSGDLELIHDASDQTVGMRWPGITIRPGATITAAWLQFAAKEAHSVVTNLTIRAQASDNPPAFVLTARDISLRPLTTASTGWAPGAWAVGEAGANQRTPDITALLQEVINRPGWASGNALAVIISGSGHRTAWAWDGKKTAAPLLHIEYTTAPPVESPPVARLTVAQVPNPALTVIADGAASTDTDLTPIASYRFDFGDGTPPVVTLAPTATASHTYAVAGTYTVTVTDSKGCTKTGSVTLIELTTAAPRPSPPEMT